MVTNTHIPTQIAVLAGSRLVGSVDTSPSGPTPGPAPGVAWSIRAPIDGERLAARLAAAPDTVPNAAAFAVRLDRALAAGGLSP